MCGQQHKGRRMLLPQGQASPSRINIPEKPKIINGSSVRADKEALNPSCEVLLLPGEAVPRADVNENLCAVLRGRASPGAAVGKHQLCLLWSQQCLEVERGLL